ncbi:MAG: toll/interleukin-1 receptor domain-containing protein [Gammaproteobacteria bacterium]
MAYVPGFEHDVFVSYARADNQGAGGSETGQGWVTTLRHNLMHAPGALWKDVFIDHQLEPGDPFDTDLLRKVERSALLLIVLSQNYIGSEWCGKELDHFVRTHGDDRSKPRDVVVVELRPFEGFEGVPENIENLRKELIHAQFWYQTIDAAFPRLAGDPSPKEAGGAVYWLERDKLLHTLDSRLKEIRRLRQVGMGRGPRVPEEARHAVPFTPAPVAMERSAGVLLADVTDDLVSQRNQVKFALEKEEIPVLPEGDYVGRSAAEFAAAFARDAQSSLLFVQLLSPTPGRIPRGETRPLPQLQFTAAREAGLPIMQWCRAVPESDVIADPAHHALGRTAFLSTVNPERFKDEVIEKYRELGKRLEAPSPAVPEAQRPGSKNIFFDDLAGDRDLAQQIRAIIKKHNYEVRGLPKGLALDQDASDLIRQMEPCQAGILVYTDRRERKTVWSRLIRFRKQVAEGRLMLARWGIYFGPPSDKGDLWDEFGVEAGEKIVAIPGMGGFNEAGLVEFLQSL